MRKNNLSRISQFLCLCVCVNTKYSTRKLSGGWSGMYFGGSLYCEGCTYSDFVTIHYITLWFIHTKFKNLDTLRMIFHVCVCSSYVVLIKIQLCGFVRQNRWRKFLFIVIEWFLTFVQRLQLNWCDLLQNCVVSSIKTISKNSKRSVRPAAIIVFILSFVIYILFICYSFPQYMFVCINSIK